MCVNVLKASSGLLWSFTFFFPWFFCCFFLSFISLFVSIMFSLWRTSHPCACMCVEGGLSFGFYFYFIILSLPMSIRFSFWRTSYPCVCVCWGLVRSSIFILFYLYPLHLICVALFWNCCGALYSFLFKVCLCPLRSPFEWPFILVCVWGGGLGLVQVLYFIIFFFFEIYLGLMWGLGWIRGFVYFFFPTWIHYHSFEGPLVLLCVCFLKGPWGGLFRFCFGPLFYFIFFYFLFEVYLCFLLSFFFVR